MPVRYLGKSTGFSQRHYTQTETIYCPSWTLQQTKGLKRSEVTLDDIRNDVLSNFTTAPVKPDDPVLDNVIRKAAEVWKFPNQVRPIHLNDLPKYNLNMQQNSPGLPWKLYGFKTKRQVLDDPVAFNSIRKFWHGIKYGSNNQRPPDCAAFVRAHLVEEGERKVRAVWGYPATISFQEACFAIPIIEELKSGDYPIAYGYETARSGHFRLLSKFGYRGNFLSSDFKSFDKTVPAWLITTAFYILAQNIDFGHYRHSGIPDAAGLFKAYKYIIWYFINTPIRLSNGERYRKNSGVASGSFFTQIVDSIVTWIVTNYAFTKLGNPILNIMILGDDSLVSCALPIDLDGFAQHTSVCGMILNKAKTQVSNDLWSLKFIGFQIRNGVPYKPLREYCAALRFPEHPDYSYDEYATRAIGLTIATFGQHERFYKEVNNSLVAPFHFMYNPSVTRFLNVLGIDKLPSTLPPIHSLEWYAFNPIANPSIA